jgi:hypothetical protein
LNIFITKTKQNKNLSCQTWWYTPVILALRRLRQEDCKFGANLGCIERPASKKQKRKNSCPHEQSLLCPFFFLVVPGLELRAYTLSHPTSSFCVRYFRDEVS